MSYDEENRLIDYGSGAEIIDFGYAESGARLWKQNLFSGALQVWIGGIDEEKGGKQLCHVFAGGKRLATVEPQSGGPYASVWAPKTLWARVSRALDAAATWPLQKGRTPITVLLTTLLGILVLSISARRGWNWNPNVWLVRALQKLLALPATLAHRMGEGLGVRVTGVERARVRASVLSTEPISISVNSVSCHEAEHASRQRKKSFHPPVCSRPD